MELGADVDFLTAEEAMKAEAVNLQVLDRAWNLWKMRVAPALAK
jgi:HCOMODA/2-hydroxy-3-carboxy-muconic semialdehyde decarboxylase